MTRLPLCRASRLFPRPPLTTWARTRFVLFSLSLTCLQQLTLFNPATQPMVEESGLAVAPPPPPGEASAQTEEEEEENEKEMEDDEDPEETGFGAAPLPPQESRTSTISETPLLTEEDLVRLYHKCHKSN